MAIDRLHTHHERQFERYRFVYPVLSRRSGGISVGINLNPDKVCNFHCVYCQVDRVSAATTTFVDTEQLLVELDDILGLVVSGALYATRKFRATPGALRRLNDIAFSGDGEPTTFRNFAAIVSACAEVKKRHALNDVKLVLITNASMFHRPPVQQALGLLGANHGEIWAKLDAGTEAYYRQVDRAATPFSRILDNITQAATKRPLVIQSLWMRIHDEPPTPAEIDAYCARLNQIVRAGGQLKLIQTCTVARQPAESFVAPLADPELDRIVGRVKQLTGLPCAAYYGVS